MEMIFKDAKDFVKFYGMGEYVYAEMQEDGSIIVKTQADIELSYGVEEHYEFYYKMNPASIFYAEQSEFDKSCKRPIIFIEDKSLSEKYDIFMKKRHGSKFIEAKLHARSLKYSNDVESLKTNYENDMDLLNAELEEYRNMGR